MLEKYGVYKDNWKDRIMGLDILAFNTNDGCFVESVVRTLDQEFSTMGFGRKDILDDDSEIEKLYITPRAGSIRGRFSRTKGGLVAVYPDGTSETADVILYFEDMAENHVNMITKRLLGCD